MHALGGVGTTRHRTSVRARDSDARGPVIVTALAAAAPANAHFPGTDGGPADRGCRPVNPGRTYVGATTVSCRLATEVAHGDQAGSFSRWRCTWSFNRAFGHC